MNALNVNMQTERKKQHIFDVTHREYRCVKGTTVMILTSPNVLQRRYPLFPPGNKQCKKRGLSGVRRLFNNRWCENETLITRLLLRHQHWFCIFCCVHDFFPHFWFAFLSCFCLIAKISYSVYDIAFLVCSWFCYYM